MIGKGWLKYTPKYSLHYFLPTNKFNKVLANSSNQIFKPAKIFQCSFFFRISVSQIKYYINESIRGKKKIRWLLCNLKFELNAKLFIAKKTKQRKL